MAWTTERIADHLAIDADTAAIVLGLVRGEISPFTLPGVDAWRRRCYHEPRAKSPETIMRAIDEAIGTYGTEAIWGESGTQPVAEYCNTGNTYNATVVYDYVRGKYVLTTMGDFVEKYEQRYGIR